MRSAQRHQPHQAPHIHTALNLDDTGRPLTYNTATAGPNKPHWATAAAEEIQQLIDTDTIQAIYNIPSGCKSTHYNPQVKEKQNNDGTTKYRVRGTIDGNLVNYSGPTTARTAAMPLVKLLIHSVVSDNKSWLTLDIKDFYLGTPVDRPEFLRIPTKYIPEQIISANNLKPFLHNQHILLKVNKGIYGLPQAGLLTQKGLIKHLAQHSYHQTDATCLFRDQSNGTDFSLGVDDFGRRQPSYHNTTTFIRHHNRLDGRKLFWIHHFIQSRPLL